MRANHALIQDLLHLGENRGSLAMVQLDGLLREQRAARRFFRSARSIVGFAPDRVTTNGHHSYPRAIRSTLGRDVRHRTCIYLTNRLEQDHRGIKGRIRCMRGFKEHEAADRFCRKSRRTSQLPPQPSPSQPIRPSTPPTPSLSAARPHRNGHHANRIIRRTGRAMRYKWRET